MQVLAGHKALLVVCVLSQIHIPHRSALRNL
jgi:hypothetical protein